MSPIKFPTNRIFPNFHILKINRMMSFCKFYGTNPVIFFSQLRPGRTNGRILTVMAYMTRRHPWLWLLGVWITTYNFKGFNPPKKNQKWRGQAWQNYKIAISPARKIGSIPNFETVIEPHSWLRVWSRITKFKFKMADDRHIAKCWKHYNSPVNRRIWIKLGWSHPITFSTCPPWCGCHGNGRCLATAHWTFSSYGRLEAERVNQFWWNLVHNSKLGPQWQSRDQILKF